MNIICYTFISLNILTNIMIEQSSIYNINIVYYEIIYYFRKYYNNGTQFSRKTDQHVKIKVVLCCYSTECDGEEADVATMATSSRSL